MRAINNRIETPWGLSDDGGEVFADGITFYTTPSHGGFRLSPERQAEFAQALPGFTPFTGDLQWLEEDCDAALVYLVWPEVARREDAVQYAKDLVRGWWGDKHPELRQALDRMAIA